MRSSKKGGLGMEMNKLKAKPLTTIALAELFFKAEDASKYAERFYEKIEGYTQSNRWSKKIELCVKNIMVVQQEMRALLEKEGAFDPIKGD